MRFRTYVICVEDYDDDMPMLLRFLDRLMNYRIVRNLQNDLKSLENWPLINFLILNTAKCIELWTLHGK